MVKVFRTNNVRFQFQILKKRPQRSTLMQRTKEKRKILHNTHKMETEFKQKYLFLFNV